jgi:dTDP-4-dehydrorhamnose 3,5-epimerase
MMQVFQTGFNGLLRIEPRVFRDERGYFFESWNQEAFAKEGLNLPFVQDNQSESVKDVIRGLHFQVPPYEQGKLVRVIAGSVLDVAVDLRKAEPTFGRHFRMVLDAASAVMLYIPPGFAHGFRTLEDGTVFAYKCTKPYHAASDDAIRWNDPSLDIDWGIADPLVSDKDRQAQLFKAFDNPF